MLGYRLRRETGMDSDRNRRYDHVSCLVMGLLGSWIRLGWHEDMLVRSVNHDERLSFMIHEFMMCI